MPRPHPPEFRQRAVELARLREKPVAQIAGELGISESCPRRWMDVADVDDGRRPGLSTDEKAELVALRRKNRVLELEVEILKWAAAYFPKENVLPSDLRLHRRAGCRSALEQCVRTMKVSRSAFYAWRHAQANPTPGMLADADLGELVSKIHDASFGIYGCRRGDR